MKSQTKVINLFGGPGIGKSTVAAGLYHTFKQNRISCELVTEFAKEVTWEETQKLLENQIHIFAEQFRRQWRLIDKVDYIITDSPILLNSIYYDYYLDKLGDDVKFSIEYIRQSRRFFDSTFCEFNNINYVLRRTIDFEVEGRNQSFEDARKIDNLVLYKLQKYNQPYIVVTGDTAVSEIARLFIEK